DPAVIGDADRLRELGQERAYLEEVAAAAERMEALLSQLDGARQPAREAEDDEMRALAEEEAEALEEQVEALSQEARQLLLPRDPLDDRPAVVEVRAGTGGDEAGLFAADLMRMY